MRPQSLVALFSPWSANGKSIKEAGGATFELLTNYLGKRISRRVTGVRSGYF